MSTSLAAPEHGLAETNPFDAQPGIVALGALAPPDFKKSLDTLKVALTRLQTIKDEVLVEDEDFGVIPGTKKPTLLQPGAQRLCMIYRLAPTFVVDRTIGDGINSPPLHYLVTCSLHFGSERGPVIGQGVGSCSSFEKKYRYRIGEKVCPRCDSVGTILKSKHDTGGWFCWKQKGGCGATWDDGDAEIEEVLKNTGRVDNPDPHDLDNTILKMSKKRAFVDAVLTATASSGMFTQDMEEDQNATVDAQKREVGQLLKELGERSRVAGLTKQKELWDAVTRWVGSSATIKPESLKLGALRAVLDKARAEWPLPEETPRVENQSQEAPSGSTDQPA